MLRSLVEPIQNGEHVLRRNLPLEDLETAHANSQKMWIDAVGPSNQEVEWLKTTFKLHPAVVSDLTRADRRPALLVYPDYLFLSLFQPQIHLKRVLGEEIHCLIGNHFFITVRQAASSMIDEAYKRITNTKDSWERGVAYFLYLTTQFVVDSYYPLVDRISNQLTMLEEHILTNDSKHQHSVYEIKQQLINLRQMVAPQREVLSSVIGEERLTKTPENRDLFRHLYERLLRVYDIIDAQRDLYNNVLDLIRSNESAHLTEAVNRLTIISIIFLPLTFVIGLFELNFVTTNPQLTIPIGGGWVLVGILFFTIVAGVGMSWLFRRKGWI